MQMPDVNKKQIGVLLRLDLVARMKKYAEDKGLTVSEAAQIACDRLYGKYPITSAEIMWIAEQTRKNEQTRERRKAK